MRWPWQPFEIERLENGCQEGLYQHFYYVQNIYNKGVLKSTFCAYYI
jgi:hypothetical protein